MQLFGQAPSLDTLKTRHKRWLSNTLRNAEQISVRALKKNMLNSSRLESYQGEETI